MASQFAVDLVFGLKGDGKIKEATDKLKGADDAAKKLKGQVDGLGREFQTAANGMRYYIDAMGKARKENGQFVSTAEAAAAGIKKQGAAAQGAAGALRGLASAFAGLAIGNKLRGSFLDAANLDATNTRAKNLVQSYGQLAGIQGVAAAAASKFQISNNQSLSDLVDLGNRLGAQGTSLKDIQNIYEGFNTLLIKNKVGTQQAAAAQLQLNQALGSGRLAGEEFNAISESAPQLLDEVAKILKRNRGELKQLAADGEISSQVLIQALTNIRTQGAADLESALQGPAGEMKRFEKAMSDFSVTVGQELLPAITPLLQEATKLLQLFGQLPGPVKTTAVSIAALGAAALVVAPAISAVVQALIALKGLGIASALIAAGPWVAAAAGVAALGKALYDTNETFRNFVDNVGGIVASDFNSAVDGMAADASSSAKTIETVYQDAQAKLADISGNIQKMFADAFGRTSQAATASASQSGSAFSSFFGSLVSQGSAAFAQLSGIISSWWASLPAPIRNLFGGGAIGDLVGAANYAKGVVNRTQAASTQKSGMYGRYASGSAQTAFKPSKPASTPSVPTGGTTTSGGRGGGGGGNGAAEAAARQQTTLNGLTREMQLITTISGMKEKERLAELAGDQALATRLQGEQKLAELQKSKADAIAQAETAAEKSKQSALFDLQIGEQKKANAFDLAKIESDRQKKLEEKLTGFDREIELAGAKTEEAKKLLEIEHQILDLKKDGLLTTDAEVQKYRERAQAAAAAGGGGGKLEQYMNKLETELADTEGMIVSLAGTIEGEIGSAMSNAITGLIDGTMTAEQAFSQMFKNIGKAFIDMATQMIAKAIVMKILGIAFGGGGGGGGLFSGAGPVALPGGSGFAGGFSMPKLFAEGGYVTGPTSAVIGEGGQSEYVIPASKMSSAMANYKAGKRGDSILSDPAGDAAGDTSGNNTFTLETVVINNVEYATVAQVREMGRHAARQGAEGGYNKTMGSLKNSRSQRSRIGLR